MSFIKDLYKNLKKNHTVFSLKDLSTINRAYIGHKLNSSLKYLVKTKQLLRLSQGLYSLNQNFSLEEFVCKYRQPSYISLETILSESGVLANSQREIYIVSQRSFKTKFYGTELVYRKITDRILLNPIGIVISDGVYKALPERAICDKIYLDKSIHITISKNIDWSMLKALNRNVYNNNQKITKWITENQV